MSHKCNIILIDNYDSFTFNLVDSFKRLEADVFVYRNSVSIQSLLEKIEQLSQPKAIVLSPGPGTPQQAGICLPLIQHLHTQLPILGICLGHQAIAEAFGGYVDIAPAPIHGKSSMIQHDGSKLFTHLPSTLEVGRYHSLFVHQLPQSLKVTAYHETMIMALQHQIYPIYGLQFHPESILTPFGDKIIENFLNLVKQYSKEDLCQSYH